jgi:hypothetical protein
LAEAAVEERHVGVEPGRTSSGRRPVLVLCDEYSGCEAIKYGPNRRERDVKALMPEIQITLARLDAQVLLPLILEQSEARAGTAGGAYWSALHKAITKALADQSQTPGLPNEPPGSPRI